ncbi:MAG TPA: AraC family transcriptional regulator [Kofleriaceae bacterium]|nr:AraC family transcriptional regulator [Kofleriaceae bacterium]
MAIDVSARIGATIVHIAALRGASVAELQRRTGFDPAVAHDPDARIAIELENALWQTAADLLDDPWFGLRAVADLRPGAFDVMDYVVRTAPTLRDALTRLARYNRLVHGAAVFHIEDRAERVRIEHAFAVPGHAPSRHASEFTLAALVVIGTQLIGAPLRPLAVALPSRPPPGDRAIYEQTFGVMPSFGAPVGVIELASAATAARCPAADPLLSDIILRQADALLATRPDPSDSFANRVRRLVSAQLGEGHASLASVARTLRLSERSLQRRLADEALTFDALVDELRRELALRYLADPALAIGEVAYLLGYSEPSAFHRAFKRWTGKTPRESRRGCAVPRRGA